jgi:hypothetical protein
MLPGVHRTPHEGADMPSLTIGRSTTALLAAVGLALATSAAITPAAHADQKSCKLPGKGTKVSSGSTGTDSDGTTYSCDNGIGCQVEGGKVTTKCSHMEATLVSGGGSSGPPRPKAVLTQLRLRPLG